MVDELANASEGKAAVGRPDLSNGMPECALFDVSDQIVTR